jgi:ABC-type transporter Mla subunit MlaD
MSDRLRIGVGLVVVAAAVVLFVVLQGGGSSDSGGKEPTVNGKAVSGVATIRVRDAKPVGGITKLDYTKGDQIRIKVFSDVADEVHFHGYDIGKDVKAGGSVTFDLPATLEGVFEIELESRKEQIAEVRVEPD